MSSPNAQVPNLHSRPPTLAFVLACAPSRCLALEEVAEEKEECKEMGCVCVGGVDRYGADVDAGHFATSHSVPVRRRIASCTITD